MSLELVLREVAEDLAGVTWWLSDGSALGVVRSGCPVGADLDVGVWAEDIPTVAARLRGRRMPCGPLEVASMAAVKIDVHGHTRTGDLVWYALGPQQRPCYRFPSRLFDRFDTYTAAGVQVLVPSPAKQYLECHYGESWRTPRSAWNYMTDPPCIGGRPR